MKSLATGASALTTFVQVLPRLGSLVARMRPTWHLPALSAVTPEFLRAHGVRGLIWDVDGVLTGDRQPALRPESAAPFRALLAEPGLRSVILSNASEERFRQLGGMFPDVPILRGYALKGAALYRVLYGGADSWTDEELAARLAQGAHVIRKPSAALVDFALQRLECARSEVVMIGDQYLTDVAGANLGGVRSAKLPTLAPGSFRRTVRVGQVAESLLFALVHGRAGEGGA